MKCRKCECENRPKAKYCINCGKSFTKEDRDEEYKKTIYFKLEQLEKKYKKWPLKKVIDSRLFRGLSLLVILVLGLCLIWLI